MGIRYHPGVGQLVYCHFDRGGFREPEMVKSRPVIIISRKNVSQICTVVPLSGKAPNPAKTHHHLMTSQSLPSYLAEKGDWWAKCDLVSTVGFWRLEQLQDGFTKEGKKNYVSKKITNDDLNAVKIGVMRALSMSNFIQ